jgi:hypothetical protein
MKMYDIEINLADGSQIKACGPYKSSTFAVASILSQFDRTEIFGLDKKSMYVNQNQIVSIFAFETDKPLKEVHDFQTLFDL